MPIRPIQAYDPVNGAVENATDMITVDVLKDDGTSIAVGCLSFSVVVVDDVFYVMGGLANGKSVSLNSQYIPLGYHGTLPSDAGFALDQVVIIAALFLTVCAIVIFLVVYFKKEQKNQVKKNE